MKDEQSLRADLHYEMWFEPPSGMQFKLTVSMRNATNDEVLELARANWDFNVKECGCRPVSARP